jgi:hypothetical protein
VIHIILYLAGSFPHLYSIKKEKALRDLIEKSGHEYHRLVSFYYGRTCNTILTLKGERVGMEPVLYKSKGKTGEDYEELVRKSRKQADILLKKFSWLKEFRFAGDVAFKAGRRKTHVKAAADRGEEVSFGANMAVTYLDHKNKEKHTFMVLRYREKPTYHIDFKSWEANPTKQDLINQMKDTWIYLTTGGTLEQPKAAILTKLGEYPEECLRKVNSQDKAGRFTLSFAKWIKFTPLIKANIFGEDPEVLLFDKLRRS